MRKRIQFIVNPSELGAGTRGSSLGPEAIMTASRNKRSRIFSNHGIKVIPDMNHLLNIPQENLFAKNIDGIKEVYKSVNDVITGVLEQDQFPIILSGDHSSAGATISAISNVYTNKKIGVLWIDAHADLHTPFTTPSGNIHGMPVSTALGIDNLDCKKNEVDDSIIESWNQLKSKSLDPENLIFIAVRDTEREEDFIMNQLNIKNYTVEEVRRLGVQNLSTDLRKKFDSVDALYVSFDVDSMDPILTSHGTGTPVPNGLKPSEAKEILVEVCKNEKLVALEIVEVNPCLDEKKNKMAETAFEILESIIETLEH